MSQVDASEEKRVSSENAIGEMFTQV